MNIPSTSRKKIRMIIFSSLLLFCFTTTIPQQLNEQRANTDITQFPTLYQIAIQAVVHAVIDKKDLKVLMKKLESLPNEVCEALINTPINGPQGKETLVHRCIRIAKSKETQALSTSINIMHLRNSAYGSNDPKMNDVEISKNFKLYREYKHKTRNWLTNVELCLIYNFHSNTLDYNGNTIAHLIVEFENHKKALDILATLIAHKACFNTPDKIKNNVLEKAISAGNLDAVQMITERTLVTLDLQEREVTGAPMIKKIHSNKDTNPLYRYLFENLELYKKRANNRYVIAPCCEHAHEPYYKKDQLI